MSRECQQRGSRRSWADAPRLTCSFHFYTVSFPAGLLLFVLTDFKLFNRKMSEPIREQASLLLVYNFQTCDWSVTVGLNMNQTYLERTETLQWARAVNIMWISSFQFNQPWFHLVWLTTSSQLMTCDTPAAPAMKTNMDSSFIHMSARLRWWSPGNVTESSRTNSSHLRTFLFDQI